ncbi:hypothetical protein PV04_05703 [Phialophora macrospora]|uniref:Zn(2)-C6 fungal-type domain-containing protein n=1 Tax=Phialophora macrospora TaxID=1851006 RepID=A0A0D2DW67_9EURO|nr:hypothetical protein PV04_05703 [Phialophora macrospora]
MKSAACAPTQPHAPNAALAGGRRPRPCDSCRKRKRRCHLQPGDAACQRCRSNGAAACTFTDAEPPTTAPKRPAAEGFERPSLKRVERSREPNDESGTTAPMRTTRVIEDYDTLRGHSLLKKNLGLQQHRYLRFVGPGDEVEPRLFDYCSFDERDESRLPDGTYIRKVSADALFVLTPYGRTSVRAEELEDLDDIERLVAPHGSHLVKLFFKYVHPGFPVLDKETFLEKYERTHREFSPPCLAGIYLLAIHWWNYDPEMSSQPKPDVDALERLAKRTLQDVIHRPKLSTLQGGLLILQHRSVGEGTWALSCQMLAVAQELGVHRNCDAWRIPPWEKRLRRRLGWALYMLDKWMAWSHGRPSHIVDKDWLLDELREDDFPQEASDHQHEGSESCRPFEHMISLTKIIGEIMRLFYSPSVAEKGWSDPRPLLEAAKPVQIKLKAWYQSLPDWPQQERNTATVQLSYFAAEITLHRAILSSLTGLFCDPFITEVCRRAARERVTGAIKLVKNFQIDQFQSFWYFLTGRALVSIGTFTALLYATSRSVEEAGFYKTLLDDYRWTLRTLSRSLSHFEYAVQRLDASLWHFKHISPEDIARGVDADTASTPAPVVEATDAPDAHEHARSPLDRNDRDQQPPLPVSGRSQANNGHHTRPEDGGIGGGAHHSTAAGHDGGASEPFLNWVDITFPSPQGPDGVSVSASSLDNRDLFHWQRHGMDFFGRDWTYGNPPQSEPSLPWGFTQSLEEY